MHTWQDYWKTDKTLLSVLILILIGVWIWTKYDKVFDLVNTFSGALLGLITGSLLKSNKNGTTAQPDPEPKEKGPPDGPRRAISPTPL